MDKAILTRLQDWYRSNCDGDWEHEFGIMIETLDNPGWSVKIDLSETSLHDLVYEKQVDNGDFDWFLIKVKEHTFHGTGDPDKLTMILSIFLDEIIPEHSGNKPK